MGTNSLQLSGDALSAVMRKAQTLALDYWASIDQRPSYPQTSGVETEALFARPWGEEGLGDAVLDDFAEIVQHSRPGNARFFGYVLGSGEPIGAIGDLLASALNQNVTAWRSAPAAVTIEHTVVHWLAEAVGCPGLHGSLCGGGSAGNLIALTMAREAKAPANEDGAKPCVIYASQEVHMSIPKAVALIGIGRSNLRLIPTDGAHRMRLDALEAAIAADRRAGRLPAVVVATAGTVAIGAIDPLAEIAALAHSEGLWMHVDGAFGGLAALAVPERFRGLNQADSISLDAHKWLYQPVDCGCVLYRDQTDARRAFSHSGDYVRTFTQDPIESFAFFDETVELSRRFRALKLWMSLQYHGRRAFQDAIRRDLDHAERLAAKIVETPELELLNTPVLSAVCFRHRHAQNDVLLQRLIKRGRVYLSNATIDGRFALRACFVNHRTSQDDVAVIVSEVLAAARDVGDASTS
ncbi:pyridoxal phosphate-dependent decarboxylase family protein [Acuticoccus sediminis]|uniref:pyridoxal phosphate-dependent decarboxylase family protein n=1 Tax=Acuticoccus sediminis TaxID=2184697 RepID=UPI001CFD9BB4|nr:aminotransferase class V-fold PLP-dependent enzyme [Acuticoccus sediminis]